MLVMHRRSRKLYKRYRRRSLAETAVSTVKRRAQKNELGLKDLSITARLPAKFGQPAPPPIEGRSPRVQTAFCADRALRAKAEGDGRGGITHDKNCPRTQDGDDRYRPGPFGRSVPKLQ